MKRIIAVLLVLMLCVSLASCEIKFGSKSDNHSATEAAPATQDPAAAVTTPAATAAPLMTQAPATQAPATQAPKATQAPAATQAKSGSKKYATVGDYLNDPTVQAQIESSKQASSGMGMDIDVYAEGDDTLVYDYTYQQHFTDAQVSAAKTQLDTQLENYESTFMAVVDELEQNVDQPNPKVKVIYRNDDGTIITSKTYQRS